MGSEPQTPSARRRAAVAAALALVSASAAPATSLAGGTYRVGLETDSGGRPFGGSTASTRPAEVKPEAFGIYSNLLLRTLVGYDHVRRSRRQPARGRSGGARAASDERRAHLHVPAQARRQVRAARQPRDHLDGTSATRSSASLVIATAQQYAFFFEVIRGFTAYRSGKARSITGIETPDARTITFTLAEPNGAFLYRLALPADGSDPAGDRAVLRGKAGRLRPRRGVVGPLHDRGLRVGQARLLQRDRADVRQLGHAPRARPQPALRPEDRHPGGAREQPGPVRLHLPQRQRDTDRRAAERRRARGRVPRAVVCAGPPPPRGEGGPARAAPGQSGGEDDLRRAEPDAAAVRRRPCAPRPELDRRQGPLPGGVRRRESGLHRAAPRPGRHARQPARWIRALRDQAATTATSPARRRRWRSRSTRRRTASAPRRPASAST